MTFLSPGYLAGLLFALLPILLHLFQRRRQRTVPFSDLRFLRQAERQRSRKLRIRELLLLLVRMLMIALLALAFARPVVKAALPPGLGGTVQGKATLALVLDNSYSMGARIPGKPVLWEQAKKRALEALDRLKTGDEVLVILSSDELVVVTSEPIRDLERARRLIQKAPLSDRGTALASSLDKAYELLARTKSPSKSILVFSDFQKVGLGAGGFSRPPPAPRPPDEVTLSLALLPAYDRTLSNTAITDAKPQSRLLARGKEVLVEVQAQRFSGPPAPQENLRLSLWLDGKRVQESGATFGPRPPHESPGPLATAKASLRLRIASSGVHEATVTGEPDPPAPPDPLPGDDQRHLVLSVPEAVSVLALADQSGPGTSAFYLTKALVPEPGAPFTVNTSSPQALSGIELRGAGGFGAVILSDVALLTEGQLGRLEAFVKEGGGLLLVPGPHTDPGYYTKSILARLLPMTLDAPLRAPEGSSFSLSQFDQAHPALGLFSNRSRGDLSQANFFQIHPCRPGQGAVTVAKFSNGGSAILERPLGKGKVIAFAFGLEQGATDLPLKAVFVPLVHQLLLYLSTQPGPPGPMTTDYLVGQDVERVVPSPGPRGGNTPPGPQALTLLAPDSSRTTLEPKVLGGQSWVSIPNVERAGIYRISSGARVVDAFAVNLDTRESDLSRMSEQELRKLLPEARIIRPEQSLGAVQAQTAAGREIWKLLVITVLLLALAEMALRERPVRGKD